MTRHDAERGARILAVIERRWGATGRTPSVREIARAVGLRSTSAVQHHIDVLVREGLLERVPGESRSLRPVATPPVAGFCHRPGCGRALTGRQTRWCSDDCTARSQHVKAWLREAGMDYVVEALRLTS